MKEESLSDKIVTSRTCFLAEKVIKKCYARKFISKLKEGNSSTLISGKKVFYISEERIDKLAGSELI